MLLCLDSLMEAVAPPSAFHDTSCLLVDNLHLSVYDNILIVLVEHTVGLEQLLEGMDTLRLYGVVCQHLILLVETVLL